MTTLLPMTIRAITTHLFHRKQSNLGCYFLEHYSPDYAMEMVEFEAAVYSCSFFYPSNKDRDRIEAAEGIAAKVWLDGLLSL